MMGDRRDERHGPSGLGVRACLDEAPGERCRRARKPAVATGVCTGRKCRTALGSVQDFNAIFGRFSMDGVWSFCPACDATSLSPGRLVCGARHPGMHHARLKPRDCALMRATSR